jgi:small nuclear ribonucleoprotein (snRNP)-like protein
MDEKPKNKEINKNSGMKEDKFLPDFVNKIVVCETLSGKTLTGVLTGHDRYTVLLVEAKDIKSKKPMQTLVFKHGMVSIRETE